MIFFYKDKIAYYVMFSTKNAVPKKLLQTRKLKAHGGNNFAVRFTFCAVYVMIKEKPRVKI